MLKGIAFILTICVSASSTIFAQEPEPISREVPDSVKVTRDIVYAEYGARKLKLDLYEPKKRDSEVIPAVVVIRGGGWRSGDKEGFAPIASALAQRGLLAVSIEYRASGEAKFPAAVHDTKAAVRWLRANAKEYRLDPEAIGAIGGSAGAHLAAYLGVTPNIASLEGAGGNQKFKSSVQAVVALAIPANFSAFAGAAADSRNNPIALFLGKTLEEDPEMWRFASPIAHVMGSSPPLLLIHSSADRTVPFGQSLEFAESYGKTGSAVEVVLIPDAPHAFWWDRRWFSDSMERSARFLLEHLKR